MLLFASAREAVGRGELAWPIPPGGLTAASLVAAIGAKFPRLRPTLATCRFVRNGGYLDDLETRLRPGDEFAVHPPYGGG